MNNPVQRVTLIILQAHRAILQQHTEQFFSNNINTIVANSVTKIKHLETFFLMINPVKTTLKNTWFWCQVQKNRFSEISRSIPNFLNSSNVQKHIRKCSPFLPNGNYLPYRLFLAKLGTLEYFDSIFLLQTSLYCASYLLTTFSVIVTRAMDVSSGFNCSP